MKLFFEPAIRSPSQWPGIARSSTMAGRMYVCMYVFKYVYMDVCMYVCMGACLYVCMY